MNRHIWLAFLAFLVAGVGTALGQGVLVNVNVNEHVALPRPILPHPPHRLPPPRPQPSSYKVKELSVQVRLADQVAKTQVSQTFVNTGSVPMEVCFVFPLPYDGAVDQLTLMVDGQEIAAKLLPADEARRLYEQIVRKNQDPALLEWVGTGLFKTSVFPVPAGAERKVTLRYSQLCRQDQGLTDYLFPLSTAKYTSQPVDKVEFQVTIESGADIKNVYSPTHAIDIKRPDNRHAVVNYAATNQVPSADFRLFFDVGAGQVGASLLSFRRDAADDGYFLLLATPEIKPADAARPAKTVVFVVDRSGSMSGEKINQAKGALKFVLNNLRAGDTFNVIAYDSNVESFRPELQKFDEATRQAALGFVEGLYAGGSTNIDGALRTALAQLTDSSRPSYVIFLTDGLPTVGETNEAKIAAAAKSANGVRARVFAFGVGYDVNSRLLDRLVRENFGHSEYVRPSENIEARVGALYSRVDSPVMVDVAIGYQFDVAATPEQGPPITRAYPVGPQDLFAGQQLVTVGRYKRFGAAKVTVTGKVGGVEQKLDFPAQFVERSGDETNAFIEKQWALRRVGEILDEMDLKGKNAELTKELVQLASKHGILTPYTSFLADEQSGGRRDLAESVREAEVRLGALSQTEGQGGFAQRRAKGYLQRGGNLPAAQPSAGGAADALSVDGARTLHLFAETAAEKKMADEVAERVQHVGAKTFFRRSDRWIDSTVTAEQEQQAERIERYSREYFELVDRHGRDVAKYLSIEEPVVIQLDGRVYAF